MRDRFSFRSKPQTSNVSLDELHSRATQLVKIQEYDIAEELYAEILKKDHENQLAKQRLTSLQCMKYGLPPANVGGRPVREVISDQGPSTAIAARNLPVISPGIKANRPPFVEERMVDNRHQSFSLDRLQQTGEVPEWVIADSGTPSGNGGASITVRQNIFPPTTDKSVDVVSMSEDLPEWAQQVQETMTDRLAINKHDMQQEQGGRQTEQLFALNDHRSHSNASVNRYDGKSITELVEVLIVTRGEQIAINEMISRIPNANRQELWQLSSALEVLSQDEYSRVAIMSRLSKSLASSDVDVRGRTLLVIAGLGAVASDLTPLVRLRLNDESEYVRQMATRAIGAIGA